MYHDVWSVVIAWSVFAQSIAYLTASYASSSTYLILSRLSVTACSSSMSSLTIFGGEALLKPAPVTSQPALSKALTTSRPSRPEAPVIRARWVMVDVDQMCRACCGLSE